MNWIAINVYLRQNDAPFMAFERPVKITHNHAEFCGMSGFYKFGKITGTVWVDNLLNRYLVLSTGEIFECSNVDLLRMEQFERAIYLEYLSGNID